MIKVIGFDHVVLRVKNQETALQFYGDIFGMEKLRVDEWLDGKVPFPSVRVDERTIIDLVLMEDGPDSQRDAHSNMDHFCIVIDRPDLKQIILELQAAGVRVDDTPLERWGARGWGTSIYVRDTDNNRIEIKHYRQA